MTNAYSHLFALLLHDPSRIGWLAHHAWRWHKGHIAMLAFSVFVTGFGIHGMVTRRPRA